MELPVSGHTPEHAGDDNELIKSGAKTFIFMPEVDPPAKVWCGAGCRAGVWEAKRQRHGVGGGEEREMRPDKEGGTIPRVIREAAECDGDRGVEEGAMRAARARILNGER